MRRTLRPTRCPILEGSVEGFSAAEGPKAAGSEPAALGKDRWLAAAPFDQHGFPRCTVAHPNASTGIDNIT